VLEADPVNHIYSDELEKFDSSGKSGIYYMQYGNIPAYRFKLKETHKIDGNITPDKYEKKLSTYFQAAILVLLQYSFCSPFTAFFRCETIKEMHYDHQNIHEYPYMTTALGYCFIQKVR
jgi:hypothetical protein